MSDTNRTPLEAALIDWVLKGGDERDQRSVQDLLVTLTGLDWKIVHEHILPLHLGWSLMATFQLKGSGRVAEVSRLRDGSGFVVDADTGEVPRPDSVRGVLRALDAAGVPLRPESEPVAAPHPQLEGHPQRSQWPEWYRNQSRGDLARLREESEPAASPTPAEGRMPAETGDGAGEASGETARERVTDRVDPPPSPAACPDCARLREAVAVCDREHDAHEAEARARHAAGETAAATYSEERALVAARIGDEIRALAALAPPAPGAAEAGAEALSDDEQAAIEARLFPPSERAVRAIGCPDCAALRARVAELASALESLRTEAAEANEEHRRQSDGWSRAVGRDAAKIGDLRARCARLADVVGAHDAARAAALPDDEDGNPDASDEAAVARWTAAVSEVSRARAALQPGDLAESGEGDAAKGEVGGVKGNPDRKIGPFPGQVTERVRRGETVEIPEEWRGHTTHPQRKRKRREAAALKRQERRDRLRADERRAFAEDADAAAPALPGAEGERKP